MKPDLVCRPLSWQGVASDRLSSTASPTIRAVWNGFAGLAQQHGSRMLIAMQFSTGALDELRLIHETEFSEEITREEAAEMGDRIVRLLRLLLRPLPSSPDDDP